MAVLLNENLPFIYLADNGFRDYYKPQDSLFDAVAAGRVLILSPWEYDPHKKRVSRADCVEMNKMAERICSLSLEPESDSGTNNKEEQSYPFPIFTERPFIRVLTHHGQLQTMYDYIRMNPQRLATKRIKPGFFRVQEGIEIAGRIYCGVGNVEILQAQDFAPVHVRRTMVEEAEHGDDKRLRDYMNGCVIKARKGTVMVSPYISQHEKEVLAVLLKEGRLVIVVADNGFGEYYKPSEGLFDSVAARKVLILSPWEYDPKKKHVSREDCVEMNRMAEEICGQWSD